jgi:hypothetical protein
MMNRGNEIRVGDPACAGALEIETSGMSLKPTQSGVPRRLARAVRITDDRRYDLRHPGALRQNSKHACIASIAVLCLRSLIRV